MSIAFLLFERKHLRQLWLCARDGVKLHYENILHILVPFLNHRTFSLHSSGVFDSLFTFVITEKLVTDVPYRIIYDPRIREHLLHFVPKRIVTADVFIDRARHYPSLPSVFFHQSALNLS